MQIQDLSLENIANDDYEQLASKIESYYKQDSNQKSFLAYHWERNHLMLDGQQWLIFEGNAATGGLWRRLQPSPANEYIPRPVTNYLFDAYQTLKGYLLKSKPRSTIRPNTQLHRDKSAAKIGELILEINWKKLREALNYEYAASCLIAYGTVFKKSYWDTSYLKLARVPRMQQMPVTDPQTGQPTGEMQEIQATDPQTGAPLYDELPLGDIATQVIEPYRMCMDSQAQDLSNPRWVMEYCIRPLSWVKENYDKQGEPGYTGLAAEVKEEQSLPSSLRRFFALKTSTGVKGFSGGTDSAGGGDAMIKDACVVKEYWERPTQANPKGRLIVVASGKTLYVGDSPCEGPESGDWHPYSECRWEIVPGRFWGKSPLDNACEIQKQINGLDSIITLNRKTMAVPQKMAPQGSIQPGSMTGQPGQIHFYRPGPNGEKPEIIPAADVSPGVFQEREMKISDLKNVTGAIDILKGDRPPGVTAASALNLLFEVGTGKLFPVLDRWKNFIETDQKKQLRFIARKYREPRPDFIQMLISQNRELTEDQLKQFVGADLYDNCNVIIEAGSNVPKLKAAEQALLLEVAPTGALNLQNPQNQQTFREKLGISDFDADFNKDVQRAEWENDLMDNIVNSPDNKPVILQGVDNDDIHIQVHKDRMKEPSFVSLPIQVQQAYFQHLMEHEQSQQQQMMMQQMQAMSSGMPPGPPPGAAGPQEPIRKGKGLTDKTLSILGASPMNPTNKVNP